MRFPRENNLQWLRLFFATQVVIDHSAKHLGWVVPAGIEHFPGVPAFFFVSGFLIYDSYCQNGQADYWRNRFLRIFPALFFVTIGGLVVVLIAHGLRGLLDNAPTYLAWFLAQITLGQSYNPSIFRDIGVGVINGSLWTITTEILFYIAIPIIVFLERRFSYAVIALMLGSFAVYTLGPLYFTAPAYRDKTLFDFIALTPIAWGWMFGFGILCAKHYKDIAPHIRYFPAFMIPAALMIAFGDGVLFGASGNRLGLCYFIAYTGLIFWLAFGIPAYFLKPDFSYGVYIWHMPIINLFLVVFAPNSLLLVLVAVFAMAAMSWYFVEKPCLSLKRRSLQFDQRPLPPEAEGAEYIHGDGRVGDGKAGEPIG